MGNSFWNAQPVPPAAAAAPDASEAAAPASASSSAAPAPDASRASAAGEAEAAREGRSQGRKRKGGQQDATADGDAKKDEEERDGDGKRGKWRRRGRKNTNDSAAGDRAGGGRAKQDSTVSGPIMRMHKCMYAYGNYDGYYHKRYDRCAAVDVRLDALVQTKGLDFFANKSVLDLGCGSGFLCFIMAAAGARHVCGVDIDSIVITNALRRLRDFKRRRLTSIPTVAEAPSKRDAQYPASFVHTAGIIPYNWKPLLPCDWLPPAKTVDDQTGRETLADAITPRKRSSSMEPLPSPIGAEDFSSAVEFPYNIEFRNENVLVSEVDERRGEHYEVLLCLQLTMWVHLHWGDDGLKVLFFKMFRLLQPGGYLVLEAQDWEAYSEERNFMPHMQHNKKHLQLKPRDFNTFLVHIVGFEAPQEVSVGSRPQPLLLYRKAGLPGPLSGSPPPAAAHSARGALAASPPAGSLRGSPPPTAHHRDGRLDFGLPMSASPRAPPAPPPPPPPPPRRVPPVPPLPPAVPPFPPAAALTQASQAPTDIEEEEDDEDDVPPYPGGGQPHAAAAAAVAVGDAYTEEAWQGHIPDTYQDTLQGGYSVDGTLVDEAGDAFEVDMDPRAEDLVALGEEDAHDAAALARLEAEAETAASSGGGATLR
eukprot:TRINITY_DN73309_c0_g1_i1.p1 TRINITY_DN73309_c0_g1~~TRINITY_DN73309_c0_g1_i1.p1  ORF type:complete len:648 (-),score=188.18 TRINITY_DN73309_c0_g1_i1:219-2162(-)